MLDTSLIQIDTLSIINEAPFHYLILLPNAPDFTIVGATNAYLTSTFSKRENIIGKGVFEAFSDNPDNPEATGVKNLSFSLHCVLEQRQEHRMDTQRYDVWNADAGKYEVKYWSPVNSPILNTNGSVKYIIHCVDDVTEKVHLMLQEQATFQKLKESKHAFRNMIQQAPVAMIVYKGEQMIIETVNNLMLEMLDKTGAIVGKPLLEVLPEIKETSFYNVLHNVYSCGQPYYGYEIQVPILKNNLKQERYFNFTYTPIWESEKITGVMEVATDVTEQVSARKKMRENEADLERFKYMADNAQDLFLLMRQDGTFAYMNNKALNSFGYVAEEARHLRVQDIDLNYNEKLFRETFSKAQSHAIPKFETSYKRKDGEIYPVEVNMGGLLLQGQKCMFAVARDISERIKYEQALKQSNERFHLLNKATQDAIWDWDLQNDSIWWNEGFKTLFGYKDADIEPGTASWYNRLHPDDKERIVSGVHSVIDHGKSNWMDEYRFLKKDGTYAIVYDRGYALHDSNGKPCRMVGSMIDITERKKYEEAIKQSEAELQRKVEERTAELQRKNKELEQFSYAASHDLKEPVRKVHVFADRLKQHLSSGLSEQEKNLFNRLENATTRMSMLIDDLLTYSNISQNSVEMKEVRLNDCVHCILEDLELEIEEKNSIIEVVALPEVRGNSRQLHQLFQNLLTNALKYSKPDVTPYIYIDTEKIIGASLPIALLSEEEHKYFYKISVKDNGIGFQQEDAERIFKMFQRLHGKAEYAGTGIGLAIAHKVVENHKGYIWAESKPGSGATFNVALPAD